MKKQETSIPLMDEIVFEKRNKMYGAYILRKMYNKQVNRALLIAIAILIAGLAYPLVTSYKTTHHGRPVGEDGGIIYLNEPIPPAELPVLPPAPPSTIEIQKQVRFVPPQVVKGEVPDDLSLLSMDDINQAATNIAIDVLTEKPAEKQVVLIEDPETTPPVIIVEEMPSFPGGDSERLKFLKDHIQYPENAAGNGIQGTVYFQFIVDSKGNITDVKILRGIGGGCDEEALRVIKMMPPWHPGRQNGRTVRVLYNMPVSFKLN